MCIGRLGDIIYNVLVVYLNLFGNETHQFFFEYHCVNIVAVDMGCDRTLLKFQNPKMSASINIMKSKYILCIITLNIVSLYVQVN